MEEIALLNPRRRGRLHRVRRVRCASPVVHRRARVRHVLRHNPRRRGRRHSGVPTISSIKGMFSKANLMNWVYLGVGFGIGVVAEKGLGERVSRMIPIGQDIPIANAFFKQLPLIAGLALLGKNLPKQTQTGAQAYIGFRLVNSALQMGGFNLSGLGGIGYTPRFGLSGVFEPVSSAALTQMSGVSDEVFNPSF
jgi:hypothetical protein